MDELIAAITLLRARVFSWNWHTTRTDMKADYIKTIDLLLMLAKEVKAGRG